MRRDLDGLPGDDLADAVGRAAPALRALDGASLFVTGGTGFFGRWFLALLARARLDFGLDLAVTVLTRDPDGFRRAAPALAGLDILTLIGGDVASFAFPQGRFTHVVHAATDTSAAAALDPMRLVSGILDGTRRVVEGAAAAGARRFLYLSSGAIYGAQAPDVARIPEDEPRACDPLDPRSAYGQAKRLAEQICTLAHARGDLDPVIARGFAFVGPGLPLGGHFAIGNFIRDAVAGRPIVVSGDGMPLRSYLYAADLAAWLAVLLVSGTPGAAYNLGSDRAIGIADLARRVAALVPSAAGVVIRGAPGPDSARNRYVPSIDKARRDLGLEAWTSLDDAIRKTASWAQSQGEPGS
ncbi:MAG TPA: NAD(P)-dependent oxidoreductase [Methylobacterium sp.]|nr:NAD(P)-dependent oxidoreductase [Methylobacterium sp.]